MKSKYEYDDYFRVNGTSHFLSIVIALLFIPHLFLSQIYISKDIRVFDSGNILKVSQNSRNEKAGIYIIEGTLTSGLKNQSSVVTKISYYKTNKTSPLLAKRKTYDSINTKKTVSGREETQKQQSLVYKPLNNQNSFSFSNGNANSVVSSAPNFSAKKDGIITKFEIEISSALLSKNHKTLFSENENLIVQSTAHKVRPPPSFYFN